MWVIELSTTLSGAHELLTSVNVVRGMFECSACGAEFRPEEADGGRTETQFDIFCPECDAGVIPGGNAEEARRQREVQAQILTELQRLAEDTRTPDHIGPQYPLERLRDDLERMVNQIDTELARREE